MLVASIQERFDQQDFQMLQKLKTTLLDPKGEALQAVCQFYGADLNQDRLETQLKVLHSTRGPDTGLTDFVCCFVSKRVE